MGALGDVQQLGIFQILTGEGTGTGFLVDGRTLVTNCHVVAPYQKVAVELRDKRRVIGTVRRVHPQRDLAIVELPESSAHKVLEVPGDPRLESDQVVRIVGFPIGLTLSVTEGVVSNPLQLFGEQHYVQTDAAINPGNSGGPIVDEHGTVVAVTTCKATRAENVGFGIPAGDVRAFVDSFGSQSASFGVVCPSCELLLEQPTRYCPSCGSDLREVELEQFFEEPEANPLVSFVEQALARAGIDPVLARHGQENWSFHHGSAPVQIWACCSEHLNLSAPLVQLGKQNLGALFRFLLSPEHAPRSFELDGNIVRLIQTLHMSDVFASQGGDAMSNHVTSFIQAADRYDDLLIDRFGCTPAPQTRLTFLKESAGGFRQG